MNATAFSALAWLVTALLFPVAVVMPWKCWKLPVIRAWALSFSGMTLAMLGQMWAALRWESEATRLRLELRRQLQQSLPPSSTPESSSQWRMMRGAVSEILRTFPNAAFSAVLPKVDHQAPLRSTRYGLRSLEDCCCLSPIFAIPDSPCGTAAMYRLELTAAYRVPFLPFVKNTSWEA